MAVKIYDASAGAFKDAPTPQIYDASTQAYKDSTGLVYDTSKGAWDERWGGKLWLYKEGDGLMVYEVGGVRLLRIQQILIWHFYQLAVR